jgi:hypothetical protein
MIVRRIVINVMEDDVFADHNGRNSMCGGLPPGQSEPRAPELSAADSISVPSGLNLSP